MPNQTSGGGGAATTPNGAPPIPNTTPSDFATYLNTYFNHGAPITLKGVPSGATLGDQWTAWYVANSKPGIPLLTYEDAFIVLWEDYTLGLSLAQGVAGGAGATGTFVNSIPQGLSAFSGFAGIDNLIGALTDSHFWLRIAEGALGIILIAVALGKITGTDNVIKQAVKKIP